MGGVKSSLLGGYNRLYIRFYSKRRESMPKCPKCGSDRNVEKLRTTTKVGATAGGLAGASGALGGAAGGASLGAALGSILKYFI